MYKKILCFLIVSCISFTAFSANVELRSDHPERYVVKKGDTLWDISAVFLKSPWLWPEIWQVNPQIRNPHLIYPGDVLELAFCDGKPCLKFGSGGGRNVKLTPGVRSSINEHAIPPIPLDVIRPFLSRPRVVNQDTLNLAPYVLASQDEHLIAGAENKVYVRGIDENEQRNRYMIFRSGETYRNPPLAGEKEGEILGYEALYIADAEMQRFGDPATALITLSKREVLVGDRFLPEEDPINKEFIPHAPQHEVNGTIISVIDGVSQIGQYQIVVLNQGADSGLEAGHVLAIHESGRFVRDTVGRDQKVRTGDDRIVFEHADTNAFDQFLGNLYTDVRDNKRAVDKVFNEENTGSAEIVELPEERIGELMVFRTFEKVSYALVMHLERPAHIYDAVHLP